MRWIPESPTFEAVRLIGAGATEAHALSALPELLEKDPSEWPAGDVSIAPDDISATEVSAAGGRRVRISAEIRKDGAIDLRGVMVEVIVTRDSVNVEKRSLLVDVPRRSATEIQGGAADGGAVRDGGRARPSTHRARAV